MTETFNAAQYIIKLPGKGGPKDYLEVKHRILWFRNDHPDGSISTELVEHNHDTKTAVFKATVSYLHTSGQLALATGYGSEESSDFGDYIEKAETKAIGRALAALGYGTQFCDDHDFGGENGRVVDAPVSKPVVAKKSPTPSYFPKSKQVTR